MDSHLSYPALDPTPEPSTSTPPSRTVLQDRLYIGNLHPTVDEYTLLRMFSKFGKVSKLDYLFHKAGPQKGKPRGYAFIEYDNGEDALKALGAAHDKLVRGRKITVTFAHQAPPDHGGSLAVRRKPVTEAGRPTTLSLLKAGAQGGRNNGTNSKIAMMEAKLRQMEKEKAADEAPSPSSRDSAHPSLPVKPPPTSDVSTSDRMSKPRRIILPHLPAASQPSPLSSLIKPPPTLSSQNKRPTKSSLLTGVKIIKAKPKPDKTLAEPA
ncbi:RNA-binding domain-containing protein [Mycena floridula]|nr:RNA-binding domain-containing protein [Mycena floridula]